jgi:hypothetical protein
VNKEEKAKIEQILKSLDDGLYQSMRLSRDESYTFPEQYALTHLQSAVLKQTKQIKELANDN